MIAFPRGQRSSEEEIAVAPAIAMDFANAEDRGREQAGDIYALINRLRETLADCIRVRTIRQVVRDDSNFGPKGSIVETTEQDQEIARTIQPGYVSHWYFGEGVSPAVVIMECHPISKLPEGVTILDASGEEIPGLSVASAIKEGLGGLGYQMMFEFGGFPIAALERTGMRPEAIWKFLEENELNWKSVGYSF